MGCKRLSRYVPRATCLTQALARQVLLECYGYPALIHVGLTKEQEKRMFQAQAWLEIDGKMVISESEVPYVPLKPTGQ
jgi:Transglutaminase-like superfamily